MSTADQSLHKLYASSFLLMIFSVMDHTMGLGESRKWQAAKMTNLELLEFFRPPI